MSRRGVHLLAANREAQRDQDETVRAWKKRWLTPQPIPVESTNNGAAFEAVAAKPLRFKTYRWISVEELPAAAAAEAKVKLDKEAVARGGKQVQAEAAGDVEDVPGPHEEDAWLREVSRVRVLRRVQVEEEIEDVKEATVEEPATIEEPAAEVDEKPVEQTETTSESKPEAVLDDAIMEDASGAIVDSTLNPVVQPAPADEQGSPAVAAPEATSTPAEASEHADPVAAAESVAAGLAPVEDPIKPVDQDAIDASVPTETPTDVPAPVANAIDSTS